MCHQQLFVCYLALGLRTAIDNMAGYEDDALQIQITAFEEHQVTDENKMPPMSHQELLDKLRLKVMYNKNHLFPLLVRHTGPIINIVFV